jgi:hypothetical protein
MENGICIVLLSTGREKKPGYPSRNGSLVVRESSRDLVDASSKTRGLSGIRVAYGLIFLGPFSLNKLPTSLRVFEENLRGRKPLGHPIRERIDQKSNVKSKLILPDSSIIE